MRGKSESSTLITVLIRARTLRTMLKRHLKASTTMAKASVFGSIKYMILHVNSVCNAKCRMCFSWEGMMDRWDAQGQSLEDLTRLAKSMEPLPQLTCSGGEPLLRKDLPDILKAFYDHANTRFFTLPTNSLMPHRVSALIDHFTENCPEAFLNFCLPFHGVEEHFDNVMGVKGNFKKFKETVGIIRARKNEHPNLSILLNFVVSKFNAENYKEIIDLYDRDYADLSMGIAYARGITHEPDAKDFPVEAYVKAQAYLSKLRKNHSRSNPYTLLFDAIGDQFSVIISEVAQGMRRNLACGAGRNFIVVYDNGAVFPCELLEAVGIPAAVGNEKQHTEPSLGNLQDFNFDMRALLQSDTAKSTINWIKTHDCACTWESAIFSKIVHSPTEALKLSANAARHLLKERGTAD